MRAHSEPLRNEGALRNALRQVPVNRCGFKERMVGKELEDRTTDLVHSLSVGAWESSWWPETMVQLGSRRFSERGEHG